MTERAALLIGVPSYDSGLFPGIPHVVEADIRRMHDVLEKSEYQVTTCGMGERESTATMNEIRRAMKTALREAPPGGVLLIYYSGHGVMVDGKSYLVPRDAFDDPEGVDVESLIELVPPGVRNCPARLIVFFVDACRNDVSGSLDPSGGGELPFPPDGAFVVVNSCGPGEWSHHSEDGSHFTHALAEALDQRSPARTLEEVIAAVKRQLKRRSALSDGIQQNPREACSQSGLTDEVIRSTEICLGEKVIESWQKAVETTALWNRADTGSTAEIRRAVQNVVGRCAAHWLEARAHLHDRASLSDVWASPEHAVRVLTTLETLVPPQARLTVTEIAAAVTAPFLREVTLDVGLKLAAGIHPEDFNKRYGERARSDLEITHDQHEHVWRRAEGLDRRGRVEAREALAMWLVHRWLSGRASLADDAEVTARVAEISTAAWGESGLTEHELCDHLGVLLRCADGGLDDEILLAELAGTMFDQRLRTLGALLWLAGVLAADARRMPSVVVDHIGVIDELSLPALHEAIRQVEWRRLQEKNELALFSICGHPAVYNVLEGVARRAGKVLRALRGLELDQTLAARLPVKITHDLLRPERKGDRPLFETPPLQFRLSDEKVRELLMGRQLYGEPELAIRELYQNALDACRYRRTRREYQTRNRSGSGHRPGGELPDWEGRITIEQGRHNGRDYIQCTDNGVGMTAQILKNTFTNAGERFIYQPAFRAENARWQDVGLELIPNSQFGVGVFSYFMIAEEIEIWTRPTDEDDNLEKDGSFVRIVSSGSLFQIEPAKEPPGGGTVVRLYLTGEDPISVLKTMRRLLWMSEFRVTVIEDGASPEIWKRDELRYSGASIKPLAHGDDFWWVSGEGGLAADGIRTNEERFGLVVNLRGRRRPRFTVDRNRLRGWDRIWIDRQVEESLPALAGWNGLTFNWLWNVTKKTPEVGHTIFEWLVAHDKNLPVEGSWAHGTAAPMARIGCFHLDRLLFNGELTGWTGGFSWLTAWRAGVWHGYADFRFMDRIPVPESVGGYPVVRPLDAAILGDLYDHGRRGASIGRPTVGDLLAASANEDESPVVRLRRLRRFAILGLDLTDIRYIAPISHRFHTDDRNAEKGSENHSVLLAVAAWTRPGTVPRADAGCWLALASEQLHLPLQEVVARAGALVPAEWIPPSPEITSAFGQRIFETADIELIARGGYSVKRWHDPTITPAQVMRMSARLGRSVAEILGAYDELKPLGYSVLRSDSIPRDVRPVEHEALLLVEEMDTPLGIFHLVVLADQHGLTVQGVASALQRIVEAGFVSLPDLQFVEDDFVPTSEEMAFIRDYLYRQERRSAERRIVSGWFSFLVLAEFVYNSAKNPAGGALHDLRRLIDLADPRRAVTTPEIIALAAEIRGTIRDAVQFYQRLIPETSDVSNLPKEAFESDLKVHWRDRYALLNWSRFLLLEEAEVTWSEKVDDIVEEAVEMRLTMPSMLGMLEPYRALGAPLPTLDDSSRESLAQHVLDVRDLRMLWKYDDDGWWESIESISPLYLLQTAGRFGWTPAQTHTRMARLRVFGLRIDVPSEVCDDAIVSWQDLLVVTPYLDGQEPALAGAVSDGHIAAAAEDIGESAAQVRERLARFAGLFGFTLSPVTDEGIPQDV